jgi:predicted transcriptional regulator
MKSLTELATELVSAQMQYKEMTTKEITDTLQQVFKTLNQLKATEISEGDTGGGSSLGDAPEKPDTDPKRSILKNKIICLECGAEFKQLTAKHLATHDLTPKEYRKKYGFPASQPLSCKSLTEKRKAMGKKRGLPAALKKKQAAARKKKK